MQSLYMLGCSSRLILCGPMPCSPPGFSVHGIFPARTLEWVAISYSRGSSWCRNWTRVSWQKETLPLASPGKHNKWSGLPCTPPGDLANPGIKPRSPALLSEPPVKLKNTGVGSLSLLQGSFWPRSQTRVSSIASRFLTSWGTKEAQ